MAVEQATRLAARGWEVQVATSACAGTRRGSDTARSRSGFRCVNVLERLWSVPVPLVSPTMLFFLWRRHGRRRRLAHGTSTSARCSPPWRPASRSGPSSWSSTPLHRLRTRPNVVERAVDRTLGRRIIRSARTVIAVSDFTADFCGRSCRRAQYGMVRPRPIMIVSPRPSGRGRRGHARPSSPCGAWSRGTASTPSVEAWRLAGLGARAELVIGGAGPEIEDIQRLAAVIRASASWGTSLTTTFPRSTRTPTSSFSRRARARGSGSSPSRRWRLGFRYSRRRRAEWSTSSRTVSTAAGPAQRRAVAAEALHQLWRTGRCARSWRRAHAVRPRRRRGTRRSTCCGRPARCDGAGPARSGPLDVRSDAPHAVGSSAARSTSLCLRTIRSFHSSVRPSA